MSNTCEADDKQIYVIKILINQKSCYYLANYDFTLSRDEKDALIFIDKSRAEKLGAEVERKYEEFKGVVATAFIELFNMEF
nr:hypothetical protein [Clostridioides sp.]